MTHLADHLIELELRKAIRVPVAEFPPLAPVMQLSAEVIRESPLFVSPSNVCRTEIKSRIHKGFVQILVPTAGFSLLVPVRHLTKDIVWKSSLRATYSLG